MVNLVVDSLSGHNTLDQLEGVWQTLERSDPLCTPFSSWLWASSWWSEFKPEKGGLRLLIVRNGREVVGIFPLCIQTNKHFRILTVARLSLLGAVPGIQSTHPGVIAHPDFRQRCEIAVLKHLSKIKAWDTLDLDGIDVNSSFAVLACNYLKGPRGVAAERILSEVRQENLPCSWSAYRARHEGKRALELKRLRETLTRGAAKALEYEFSICSTHQALQKSQDVFYTLARQAGGKNTQSQCNSAALERFMRAIVAQFFVADMLWQLTLTIDQRIVGVQHYFIWRGDLLFFQGAYTSELNQRDVASYMLAYTIRRGIGQTFRRVRIHSLAADFSAPIVCDLLRVSRLLFTPAATYRIVEKLLEAVNKPQ